MAVPSPEQLHRSLIGILGPDDATPAERLALQHRVSDEVEPIRAAFGIPDGVYERESIYLGPRRPFLFHILSRVFRRPPRDREISADEAARLHRGYTLAEGFYTDLALLTVVMLREHDAGLIADTSQTVDSYQYGGLDYLGREMRLMPFLPGEVRRRWHPITPYEACERVCRDVQPAAIPMNDEVIAYAAMLRRREDHFRSEVAGVFGSDADSMLAQLTVRERRAWTQLTFGRQNGSDFVRARRATTQALAQEGRQFGRDGAGLHTVLTALRDGGRDRYAASLSSILTNPIISSMASVRIARVRAAEAEVLERLHLLPQAGAQTH